MASSPKETVTIRIIVDTNRASYGESNNTFFLSEITENLFRELPGTISGCFRDGLFGGGGKV